MTVSKPRYQQTDKEGKSDTRCSGEKAPVFKTKALTGFLFFFPGNWLLSVISVAYLKAEE